jgi:hypothetical protein
MDNTLTPAEPISGSLFLLVSLFAANALLVIDETKASEIISGFNLNKFNFPYCQVYQYYLYALC